MAKIDQNGKGLFFFVKTLLCLTKLQVLQSITSIYKHGHKQNKNGSGNVSIKVSYRAHK